MNKLSTEQIKINLTKAGYSKLKRMSKSKNETKCIVRIFSTDKGEIEVLSDPLDQNILHIKPYIGDTSTSSSKPFQSSLEPVHPITVNDFKDYINKEGLDISLDLNDILEVLGVMAICRLKDFKEYKANWGTAAYETFIIKTKSSMFLYNAHYGELLDFSKDGQIASSNMTGIYLESDFEYNYPTEHIEMHIPADSLMFFICPEYAQLIFISPDLKTGLTTSECSNEADVSGNHKELLKKFSDLIPVKENDTLEANVVKSLKKYAFVNFHM